MHPDALKRLMAALLAEQPEPDEAALPLDETRLRRALSGEAPLSAAEQALLWRSPAARLHLAALHEAQRARQYLAWKRAGLAGQITYLAAADAPGQPVTIDTHPHLTIKLFPLDAQGERWTVFLKLSEASQETLISGIRLLDSGGLLWLTGQVDDDGELSTDWTHAESPLQRLHRYELRLEPL